MKDDIRELSNRLAETKGPNIGNPPANEQRFVPVQLVRIGFKNEVGKAQKTISLAHNPDWSESQGFIVMISMSPSSMLGPWLRMRLQQWVAWNWLKSFISWYWP